MLFKPRTSPPLSIENIAGTLVVGVPFLPMIGPAAIEIAIVLTSLLFLFDRARTKDWAFIKAPWIIALLGFWLCGLLSNLLVRASSESFYHATVWIRFILFAAALAFWILPNAVWRKRLILSCLTVSCLITVNIVMQFALGFDMFGHAALPERSTAVFGKPIPGFMLATFSMPVLFSFAEKRRVKTGFLFALGCCLALALTGERFSLLLGLAGFVLYALMSIKTNKKLVGVFLAAPILLLWIVFALNPTLYNRQITNTLTTIENISSSHYGKIWSRALRIAKDHPFIGVGTHAYRYACIDPKYGVYLDGKSPSPCVTHPHNIYIEWLTENGLLGLAGCLTFLSVLFVSLYKKARTNKEAAVLLGLSLYLGLKLLPFVPMTSFYHAWAAVPFWLMLGWAMSYVDPTHHGKKEAR